MMSKVILAAPPLAVEITNHTDWWAQWLPPAITLLVAFIALGGVIRSNNAADKRGKQDREDARERDFVLWQREAVLRAGTEALEASIAARGQYTRLAHDTNIDIKQEHLAPVLHAVARVETAAEILRLLGAKDGSEWCTRLYEAMGARDITSAMFELNAAYSEDFSAKREAKSDATEAAAYRFKKVMRPIESAQAKFNAAIEGELHRLRPVEPRDG
jgi:hypothetical protein